jgi:Pyruvate/2-oxoacid:ferredoxin oxidoreductase delta subunit
MRRSREPFVPDPEQMALWPAVSGNAINGVDEPDRRPPSRIYWHAPDATPHGPLQRWFYARSPNDERLARARAERQSTIDAPLAPLAPESDALSADGRSAAVAQIARALGADDVGIARMRPEWVFEGCSVPQRWVIVIAVAHDFEQIRTAPDVPAAAEVVRQYGRGNRIAKGVASWLREHGHDAVPHGGPMAGPAVLIPPAIECGFGELGKHGSLIHRRLGASFRLAAVFTDAPLVADAPDTFGADDFCTRCRVCSDACPPAAIADEKRLVRGEHKWYVDFDRCLPYFNEHMGCAICVAVCPWSLPGVAGSLVEKMARRRARDEGGAADRGEPAV